jgi:hypothetical protein
LVDTDETTQASLPKSPGELATERPVDLKAPKSKVRPQDTQSRDKQKPQ